MPPFLILFLCVVSLMLSIWILPLWVLLRGALFRSLTFSEKCSLALKMARTWPISHFFFVMGISFKKVLLALVILGGGAVFLLGGGLIRRYKSMRAVERKPLEEVAQTAKEIDFSELSPEEAATIKKDIEGIVAKGGENQIDNLLDLSEVQKAKVLKSILEDGRVDAVEYQKWESVLSANSSELLPLKTSEPLSLSQAINREIIEPMKASSAKVHQEEVGGGSSANPVPMSPSEPFEITYFPDGGIKSMSAIGSGLKHGISRTFRPDKTLYFETTYIGGTETGVRRVFSPEGKVISQVQMFNGEVLKFIETEPDPLAWLPHLSWGDDSKKRYNHFLREVLRRILFQK